MQKPKRQRKVAPRSIKEQVKKKAKPIKKQSRKTEPVRYQSFKLRKKIKVDNSGIPSTLRLFVRSVRFLVRHPREIFGLAVVYGILYVLLSRIVADVDLEELRAFIAEGFGEAPDTFAVTAILGGILLGQTGSSIDEAGAVYNVVLAIIYSLSLIWTIRRLEAGKSFQIRDAFYKGMAPLIPFIIILLIISIQLLPFAIGSAIYSVVVATNVAVGPERFVFASLWFATGLLSAYLLTTSIPSLYVVTLPDMRPLQALRATKRIIEHRRWFVFRRIFGLLAVLVAIFAAVLLGVVYVAPRYAFLVIDFFAIMSLPVIHIYLYKLYRALI